MGVQDGAGCLTGSCCWVRRRNGYRVGGEGREVKSCSFGQWQGQSFLNCPYGFGSRVFNRILKAWKACRRKSLGGSECESSVCLVLIKRRTG